MRSLLGTDHAGQGAPPRPNATGPARFPGADRFPNDPHPHHQDLVIHWEPIRPIPGRRLDQVHFDWVR